LVEGARIGVASCGTGGVDACAAETAETAERAGAGVG